MRYVVSGLFVVALAGCSAQPSREDQRSESMAADVASDSMAGRSAAPGISVTAAPGVAFNYRYAFRLPAARISAAQEGHAQACEKLGISRCRITGMRYSLTRDNQIDAMLAFKLDPTLARNFGRQGIAAIEAAEGMLTDAEITGTDAGAVIDRLSAEKRRIADERARIERDLAQTGLTAAARAELLRQRGELDRQVRSTDTATEEQRESLANTPMTFSYESGTAIRGFNARSPFTQAIDTGIASAQATLAVVLGAIALLTPPGLILLLAWFGWRAFRRRWPAKAKPAAEPVIEPAA